MSKLFVLSGPSGSGKNTLIKKLPEVVPEIRIPLSATTRLPRNGERHGVNYLFMDQKEFTMKDELGYFLESAVVHGNLYGTPIDQVIPALDRSEVLVVDLDVQGGMQIKRRLGDRAILIFVDAPNPLEREKRLRARPTGESEEEIRKRLTAAVDEIKVAQETYQYFVINDDLNRCLGEVQQIIVYHS